MSPARDFAVIEHSWTSESAERILGNLSLARKLRVEFCQLLVLRRKCRRLLQELLPCLPQIGDLPLQSLSLSGQGFKLFSILFFDCVQAFRQ